LWASWFVVDPDRGFLRGGRVGCGCRCAAPIIGNLPADFEVAGEALRVITPLEFEDIDD
jgi:hypothetical protein